MTALQFNLARDPVCIRQIIMKLLAILEILTGIVTICASQQTDDAFLQNVLNTGPLSTGSADEERDSSLESYLQDQYFDFKQQIVVGKSPLSAEKFDLMQIVPVQERTGSSTTQDKILDFVLPHPAPADPNKIIAASLRIYLPSQTENKLEAVEVYQVVEGQPLNSSGSHRLISVQFIDVNPGQDGQWVSFNLLATVMDWLQGSKPNLGLLIVGLHYFRVEKAFLRKPTISIKYHTSYRGSENENTPRFEVTGPQNETLIHTDEILTAITKNTSCKRFELRVNFRLWGLLEPRYQDIGYCSGSCGISELGPGVAEHTAMIALLSERDEKISGPKCSASKYAMVAVMYKQASGNYIIKQIPRLAVKKCDCH
ncbi:growth/differentiation factor 8-like [Cloeon dipterum]|uniref:growth/differentiation factor 8-like n=1 Tax=Cloeon dipterum TaxID=197152 RepID=UPI00322075EB